MTVIRVWSNSELVLGFGSSLAACCSLREKRKIKVLREIMHLSWYLGILMIPGHNTRDPAGGTLTQATSNKFCCELEMTPSESKSPRATRDVFKYQRTIIAFNCKINCVKWPDFSLVLRFISQFTGGLQNRARFQCSATLLLGLLVSWRIRIASIETNPI